MAGIPLFAGFVSKFYLAGAAVHGGYNIWITLPVLAISAFLSGVYFFPVIFKIYSRETKETTPPSSIPAVTGGLQTGGFSLSFTLICLMAANVALGMFFVPLLEMLETGFLWLG